MDLNNDEAVYVVNDMAQLSIAAINGFRVWNKVKQEYMIMPDVSFEYLRCFRGESSVTAKEAIDRLSKTYDISDEIRVMLIKHVDIFVECDLLVRKECRKENTKNIQGLSNQKKGLPAFIIGTPRSGTSIVTRLVNGHPDVNCSMESHLVENISSFLEEILLSENSNAKNFIELAGYRASYFYSALGKVAIDCFNDIAKQRGKSRWVEKSCYLQESLNSVDRLFGHNVLYVFIVRNPCSTIESMVKNKIKLPTKYEKTKDYTVNAAMMWKYHQKNILRHIESNPDRTLLIKYEEFLRSTEKCAAEIFHFLGVQYLDYDLFSSLSSKPGIYAGGDKRAILGSGNITQNIEPVMEGFDSHIDKVLNITKEECVALGYSLAS